MIFTDETFDIKSIKSKYEMLIRDERVQVGIANAFHKKNGRGIGAVLAFHVTDKNFVIVQTLTAKRVYKHTAVLLTDEDAHAFFEAVVSGSNLSIEDCERQLENLEAQKTACVLEIAELKNQIELVQKINGEIFPKTKSDPPPIITLPDLEKGVPEL